MRATASASQRLPPAAMICFSVKTSCADTIIGQRLAMARTVDARRHLPMFSTIDMAPPYLCRTNTNRDAFDKEDLSPTDVRNFQHCREPCELCRGKCLHPYYKKKCSR